MNELAIWVDLRRLRLKGVIHRIPKTHRYTATSYGLEEANRSDRCRIGADDAEASSD